VRRPRHAISAQEIRQLDLNIVHRSPEARILTDKPDGALDLINPGAQPDALLID
jgi:hypothetical protein